MEKMDVVHATEPAVGMNVAIRSTELHKVDALIPDNLASRQAKIIGELSRREEKQQRIS